MTPIDKTNGNVALICQINDAVTLLREFGATKWTNIWKLWEYYHDTLLKKHSDDILKYCRIFVSEDHKRLYFFRYFI